MYELDPSGKVVPRQEQYHELASGLNHLVNGQYMASSEEINILLNGTAVATNGQHQASFPGDDLSRRDSNFLPWTDYCFKAVHWN